MLTVTVLVLLIALLVAIASTLTPPKAPLWVSVVLLILLGLLQVVPLR
jgi:predicted membrane channel-forming protein YqfA (hemolysin III family)